MTALRAGIVVAVLVACATPARAFKCTRSPEGPSLAWPQRTVTLRRANVPVVLQEADVDRVVAASAATWTDVDCSDMTVAVGPTTEERVAGFDWAAGSSSTENQNVVVFRADEPGDPVDAWLHSFSALAITTVTFVATSGRILDADVEFNAAGFEFTTCDPGPACDVVNDLENTLTHEVGHVVGLDHPPSLSQATMFASAPTGDVEKRTLDLDDEEGICFLYPEAAAAQECYGVPPEPPPAVRFEQVVCGAGGRAAPLAALLLLLLLVQHPGRRRSRS